MEAFIAGEWVSGAETVDVRSPYSGDVIETVPMAGLDDVDRALEAAVEGARAMAALPAHERAAILHRAADLIEADEATLAGIITAEQGKHLAEARAEASRIAGIVRLCADEGLRLFGEALPRVGRLGYTRPEPTGVVVAITPFNYPAILVIHKIGPALAAGNAVVLKPALATPLTALFLVARLLRAGLPPLGVQCLIGRGSVIGLALCADARTRKVAFSGSPEVGDAIARAAGAGRLTCELGGNAALVILGDGDVDRAVAAVAHSGYANAGQNCVSTQRVLVHRSRRNAFLERLRARTDRFSPGDPADPRTDLGPVISEEEAERVVGWIGEAGGDGDRDGSVVAPAVVVDPPRESRMWRDELFGPAVGVRAFDDDREALRLANDTRHGLAASVITRDVDRALRFAHGLRAGLVNVNPTWRTDVMPVGKERVRDAVRDMTEDKLVVVHPREEADVGA